MNAQPAPDGWEVIDSAELARLRRIEKAAREVLERVTYDSLTLPHVIRLQHELGLPT